MDRQIEASLLADDPTRAERIVAKLSEDLAAAKRRRTALQIDREGRTAALARVRNLDDLVSEAALRLPGMDREQRAQLLALLNLRVDVLDAPPPS